MKVDDIFVKMMVDNEVVIVIGIMVLVVIFMKCISKYDNIGMMISLLLMFSIFVRIFIIEFKIR